MKEELEVCYTHANRWIFDRMRQRAIDTDEFPCVHTLRYCIRATIVRSIFFFFSSRRRHTRCSRDWSSDVCSSDLTEVARDPVALGDEDRRQRNAVLPPPLLTLELGLARDVDSLVALGARRRPERLDRKSVV